MIGGIRYAEDFAVIWRGLNAVAVELDLVEPALPTRHALDGRGKRWLNKARKRSLLADSYRPFSLQIHFVLHATSIDLSW